MSDTFYLAARAVLATMGATMKACGLEFPRVYVARQGTAADDGCPCEGTLVAIWQPAQPADGTTSFQPVPGVHRLGPCVPRIEDSFRVRYTRCWPAVVAGDPPKLPTPEQIDAAARTQLAYLSAFQSGLYGGEWASDLPAVLAGEEWRVGRIEPAPPSGGCAGWQALVTFSHDLGA